MSMIKHLMEMQAELEDTIRGVVNHIVQMRRRMDTIDTETATRSYLKDNNAKLTDEQILEVIERVNARLLTDRLRTAQAVQK